MNSSNEAALLSIGALLLFVGVGSGIYFFSSNNSTSSTSSGTFIDDNPAQTAQALDIIGRRSSDVDLGAWGGGKRGRKTRRNMHRLKLVKKKTKGVGRSHRRSHK
jgi:hypothetical protein